MAKVEAVVKLVRWWRSLDHSLKAAPHLKQEVQDARAYPVFFRQLASLWKELRRSAFAAVEPSRLGLVRAGENVADDLTAWLDRTRVNVFEDEEGIILPDGRINMVRTVIGPPIRPLFETWMNAWYHRIAEFKKAPLAHPPHHILGFDWRLPELRVNPNAVTSGEQVSVVRGLWRFPIEAGELYLWPRIGGHPVPPPPESGIETSTAIPGAPGEWAWLASSWGRKLGEVGVQLNKYYCTIAESPWIAVLLLDTFAGDGVADWRDSRQEGDPPPMHPYESMIWAELINERYRPWCVRHFPPDTPISDIAKIAPWPPSRLYGLGAFGPTGTDPYFSGRRAHPLACVVAFLLDDLSAWVDQRVANKTRRWTTEDLMFEAMKWRQQNPKGTQHELADHLGVSPSKVSRHANFAKLDSILAANRNVPDAELDRSSMQVRKRIS